MLPCLHLSVLMMIVMTLRKINVSATSRVNSPEVISESTPVSGPSVLLYSQQQGAKLYQIR